VGMKLNPDLERQILERATPGVGVRLPEEGEVEVNRRGDGTGLKGQRSKKRQGRDDLTPEQRAFLLACEAYGLPEPVPEYTFAAPRKWRFDWLFDGWLAVEIQGGLFTQGRHVRGAALKREYQKLNEAAILGFTVLLTTPDEVKDGSLFPLIKRALGEVT
jgi:hypothetical protein